jgi:hypothetical protein
VSYPVKTTRPRTHLVLRSDDPRSSRFDWSKHQVEGVSGVESRRMGIYGWRRFSLMCRSGSASYRDGRLSTLVAMIL